MTIQPLNPSESNGYDAEVACELANGRFIVYRKEARHSIWFRVADLDTDRMEVIPSREHDLHVRLGAIWFNYKTISGLQRKS